MYFVFSTAGFPSGGRKKGDNSFAAAFQHTEQNLEKSPKALLEKRSSGFRLFDSSECPSCIFGEVRLGGFYCFIEGWVNGVCIGITKVVWEGREVRLHIFFETALSCLKPSFLSFLTTAMR